MTLFPVDLTDYTLNLLHRTGTGSLLTLAKVETKELTYKLISKEGQTTLYGYFELLKPETLPIGGDGQADNLVIHLGTPVINTFNKFKGVQLEGLPTEIIYNNNSKATSIKVQLPEPIVFELLNI